MRLLPGKYRIKFLARDAETGRIGTFMMNFVVPNLNREVERIATSSVVHSSQRVDMKDAVFNVGNAKQQQAQLVNSLVMEGQKLIPSVTRVFSRSKQLYIFTQAYQQGEAPANPLIAYASFYRDGHKAFETTPVQASDAAANRLKTIAFRLSVPMEKLEEGEYLCQVTIIDATGKKMSHWQAPIMVVP